MLEKLNVSKSLGPDGLHSRILYETRIKITTSLKLIFEAFLKLKELPHDWVNANISAVYTKGKKSELCTGAVPKGGEGRRPPVKLLPPVPPPKKKVQDKAVTCQNFLLKL